MSLDRQLAAPIWSVSLPTSMILDPAEHYRPRAAMRTPTGLWLEDLRHDDPIWWVLPRLHLSWVDEALERTRHVLPRYLEAASVDLRAIATRPTVERLTADDVRILLGPDDPDDEGETIVGPVGPRQWQTSLSRGAAGRR